MPNKNQNVHTILLEIIKRKREDLIASHPKISLEKIKKSNKKISGESKFKNAIQNAKEIAVITEIKFASPSNPLLGSKEDLLPRAKMYETSGADCISIITEPHFFNGDISFIPQVKKQITIPVLQKDFVIDAFQIYEAKELGSDALLLIARLLDQEALQVFVSLCQTLGIEPVVEINNQEDLEKALGTTTEVIAVNARNLETFTLSVSDACVLLQQIPDRFITLGFSGIHDRSEVLQYKQAGAKGVLVGTSLMQTKNITEFIGGLKV